MKQFYYNVLLEKEDLADRVSDIELIVKAVKANKKLAIYAPRRYGKSSIAKNIIPQELDKKIVTIYCDFMGAQSVQDVASRMARGLAEGMEHSLPTKSLLESTKQILKNISVTFEPNPITGEASFGLSLRKGDGSSLVDILRALLKLAEKYKCLFVFDEFQDILNAEDSLSLMRSDLQKLKNTPMLFLGSKRRLLSEIFNSNQSPFFNFADEYVLKPIPIEEWRPFFEERLRPRKIKLRDGALRQILDLSLEIPNTICEIGSYVQTHYSNIELSKEDILKTVDSLIDAKSEGFLFQLGQLNRSDRRVIAALAENGFTAEIQGKSFQRKTGMSLSGIKKTIIRLYDSGLIEEENQKYRVSNPLFGLYLVKIPPVG